jgi:hypothetical protein
MELAAGRPLLEVKYPVTYNDLSQTKQCNAVLPCSIGYGSLARKNGGVVQRYRA